MEMADICGHLHKPLVVVDAGLKVVRFVYSHPVLVAGGLTALLIWRRKGIAGVAERAWRLLYRYPSAILFGLKLFYPQLILLARSAILKFCNTPTLGRTLTEAQLLPT